MKIAVKSAADIDPQTWKEVIAVLDSHGFAISDAFRLMLMHTAAGKELPFDCIIPGPKTIAAIMELERGDVVSHNSVADLRAYLNTDDDEDG